MGPSDRCTRRASGGVSGCRAGLCRAGGDCGAGSRATGCGLGGVGADGPALPNAFLHAPWNLETGQGVVENKIVTLVGFGYYIGPAVRRGVPTLADIEGNE